MIPKHGVNLFEYDNFRAYLREVYTRLKTQSRRFSFRWFSKEAGFRSPNFLKLVMDDQRNLSPESVGRLSIVLAHSVEEAEYFRILVLFNQAATAEERSHFAEQILRFKGHRRIHPLKKAQFRYYTRWYYIPVRELVALPDFQEDPAWIARRMNPAISPSEAEEAIEALIELGFVIRDGNGHLKQSNSVINTDDEVSSASVASFHKEMLKKASESIDRIPREKREISAVTFGVSKERAIQIKERVQAFRKEILELVSQDEKPEVVYQLNFQLFPLTKESDGKEEGES